jgi:hypothetical protein
MLLCYLRRGDRVFETYYSSGRGLEVMAPSYGLLDMTGYGRQEAWEDSPAGWPQRWEVNSDLNRTDGRPTAQWSRLSAGRSDDPGNAESRSWQRGETILVTPRVAGKGLAGALGSPKGTRVQGVPAAFDQCCNGAVAERRGLGIEATRCVQMRYRIVPHVSAYLSANR